MDQRTIKLGEAVEAKLKEIARQYGSGSVAIGFMEGATYPDGTPVASVAFWNEYGHKGKAPAPPRPFFRGMIARNSAAWPLELAASLRHTRDSKKALAFMGEQIEGELKQSITDLVSPPLAKSTIRRKGFDKPLIDTSHMINSTSYRVTD